MEASGVRGYASRQVSGPMLFEDTEGRGMFEEDSDLK